MLPEHLPQRIPVANICLMEQQTFSSDLLHPLH
jgi:hypothetical protein